MTKEEVLQKANEYCNEKSYNETLTDEFKDKFSEFFAKKYPDTQANDEAMIADLQFNLNTAFSATSKGITSKQKAFDEKESGYKRQIEELNKRLGSTPPPPSPELPQEWKDKFEELEQFKTKEAKKNALADILSTAKASIRQDLHGSFEKFAEGYEVNLEKTNKEQADSLVSRFQAIFKDSLGDIKPLQPRQQQKRNEDIIASVPKVTIS